MRISDWSSDVCSSDLDQDIVAVFVHQPGRTLLVASSDGRGFLVPEDEVVAQTKNGRHVLNPGEGMEAAVCRPVEGDHVAVTGANRKLRRFTLAEDRKSGE